MFCGGVHFFFGFEQGIDGYLFIGFPFSFKGIEVFPSGKNSGILGEGDQV
jgi:hypothetical protein